MCGIVGAVRTNKKAIPVLLSGLRALEYRGYDSAGVAVIENGKIECVRSVGKVAELEKRLREHELKGSVGIAHTRWATHGVPSEKNAHPHVSDGNKVAVVHNGIIENHEHLRALLESRGYKFSSETDTEVIAHLIDYYLSGESDLFGAVEKAVRELKGAYAIAVISPNAPDKIVAARFGSPLVVGFGNEEMFVASDVSALISETNRFVYLENGDVAEISANGCVFRNAAGKKVHRPMIESELTAGDTSLGEFRHFMQKEIYEQPEAVRRTVERALQKGEIDTRAFGAKALSVFRKISSVQIVACGTSYHAGLAARYWLEPLADLPCNVDVASEYRYRNPRFRKGTLYVFISQSGETADTLACLNMVKKESPDAHTLAICNVPESSLMREASLAFLTRAGKEIGVASTKAFTTQLVSLLLLTVVLGRIRHTMAKKTEKNITEKLLTLPGKMEEALLLDSVLRALAPKFVKKEHCLYLGRGIEYPIALEGALKLKEISYIHAEGYQAGELKHGPLALVDENMPVIAVAPNDALAGKLQSNLKEVRARNGKLFIFASPDTKIVKDEGTEVVLLPEVDELLAPIVYVVPLQLFAYHVADQRGKDVDKPRNLAKSVTVE
ncbi:MAG: glutamine--fructose-6-phosphate transaminase (isomerizing) [Candidatus Paceibacterota bacterium]|jgi:glucosamine--fructose-6-phosphate aminotransferase (isomerizing)